VDILQASNNHFYIYKMPTEKKPVFNLRSILDSHENPFVIIDENYTIIEANRAYCTRYDTTQSEIVGSKCHMVHHKSALPCHSYGEECPMQMVMDSGERYEVSHVHHNHEYHPQCVSIKGFPIADEDGNRYLGEEIIKVASLADATERSPIQSMEARYISELLVEHNGHRRKVAEILKISERTLYRKLVNHNLTNVGKGTPGEVRNKKG
jgi:transcriptional regulator with PAS, ATPase and Fis domain